MSVKDRLYEFCRFKRYSILGFERACGLSNGYVSSVRNSVGLRSLELIMKTFPELNRDWLLYGEGEMINKNVVIPSREIDRNAPSDDSERSVSSLPSGDMVIPAPAWAVIQMQAASLERKDSQLDRCISMLESSFALLKGAAVRGDASAAAAAEPAG